MKSPIDNVKVSSTGRSALNKAKKDLKITQWNELLRNAFCLSIQDEDRPTKLFQFDVGIDPIDWKTFAGDYEAPILSLLYLRAQRDEVDTNSKEEMNNYFRLHIERGVAALRSFDSIAGLCSAIRLQGAEPDGQDSQP